MPLDTDLLVDAESLSYLSSPLATCSRLVPTFRPRDHQKIISDAIVDAQQGRGPRFIAVSVGQQYGKAIHVETPIPTPSGWTTMGELRVGDEVFTADGSVTHVVAATPIFEDRPCYSITFDDGERIMADAEHLWRVALDRGPRSHITTLHTTRSLAKHRYSSPRINNTEPICLPEISLPIDPYVLGVWLGDGHTGAATITKKNYDDAEEIFGRFRESGYTVRELKTPGSWVTEGLFANLRAMGLIGHKHIPPMYLRASEDQRWALLQGLIDTDGYVEPKRGTIEFCTTKEDVAEGAEELLHSLGIKVMVKKGRAKLYGRDIGPKWRMFFYHPNAAFLTRKRERCREPERQKHRYARHVVEIPSVPVRCIQVAHESGMYLCGRGMVPTHNSLVTSQGAPLWWLELHSLGLVPGGLVGLMSYEDSLAMSWSTKIRRAIEADPDAYFSRLRKDSKAASYWETEQGGGIIAIGTAGSIQGRPISFLGIDDPTKNFDQAMSLNHQDKLWDLWTSVIFGRLQPWTIVLVTMARWAPYDFIGRLASTEYEGDPADWRFINIPVLADAPDDPLGRELGDPLIRPQVDQTNEEALEELARVKRSISTYAWNCVSGDTRVLMEDFTSRPISEIKEGQSVVGWEYEDKKWARMHLRPSEVLHTMSKEATVWEYHMESGRVVRATEDHRWFIGAGRRDAGYGTAKVGTNLRFIMEPQDSADLEDLGWWQYLAGIVDGEGSIEHSPTRRRTHLTISQTRGRNAPVANRILEAMDRLGLEYSVRTEDRSAKGQRDCDIIYLKNVGDVYRKLIRLTHLGKKDQVINALYHGAGRYQRHKDKVIWIGNPKREKVYALTTETGNYIAGGYASSNSLWMQNPRDAEGTIFSETKWRYWGGDLSKDERIELPSDFDQLLFSWDLSFKDLKTSDFVVGGLWGRVGMDFFLIDLVRGRWSFTETCSRMTNFVTQYRLRYPKANTVVIEDKANGPAIISQLRSRVGGLVEFDPSDYGSKLARAHAIQPFQLGGNIYLPAASERAWVRDYVQELADFRGDGQGHDDQVDMTTQAINYMTKFQYAPVDYVGGDEVELSVIRP